MDGCLIPFQNRVWIPAELMHEILGEIHYMPDKWKQRPHTVEVYKEYTQVFQFTLVCMCVCVCVVLI